ncbi:MAG: DUF512 domain-containing protein [Lachnospiraceae bacterium]|nr:DUF512 domain-containing protein [Lachnospiraceae bacterium]
MNGKKIMEHKISAVEPGSIAEELELEPGDVLVSVNGEPVEDIFDYHYLTNEEYLEILVRKADGEEWELEIEKEFEEDLGITFENSLMDEYRSCCNHCIFCFIDQMPKGMRDTLYFKDDDSRLSFLQGNYVTLTNMSDHDIERIIRYHLEPINISFQTMNPKLRCEMLHNRFAGDVFPKVERLFEAGIEMNGQIVLCRGINDGKELEYSISQLEHYIPHLKSVSVVPVGLTRFREGLAKLEPFTREDAVEVLGIIEKWQQHFMKTYGTHLIHAGDEWYLLAEREMPEADSYDGYLQLENGVGMMRLLQDEVSEALKQCRGDDRPRRISIATGVLAYSCIEEQVEKIKQKYPRLQVNLFRIKNNFFGERITVSGLITGADLKEQLAGADLGERLLLPCSMLRTDETVFLDDVTVEELEKTLQIPIDIVKSSGQNFVDAVIDGGNS